MTDKLQLKKYCPQPKLIKNKKVKVQPPSFLRQTLYRHTLRKAGAFLFATSIFMVFLISAHFYAMREYKATRQFVISNGGSMSSNQKGTQLRIRNSIGIRDGAYAGTFIELEIFLDFGWTTNYSTYWIILDNQTVKTGTDTNTYAGPRLVTYTYMFHDDGNDHYFSAEITTNFTNIHGETTQHTHYEEDEVTPIRWVVNPRLIDLQIMAIWIGWLLFYRFLIKFTSYHVKTNSLNKDPSTTS